MGVVQTTECERARMQASLALDGELSELGQASLRAHMASCAACASFEHELAAWTRELRSAPPVLFRATVGVVGRPASAVRRPRRRATVRVLQLSAAAAAVVLAAGLGSLFGSLTSPSATTTTTAGAAPLHGAALINRGYVAMAPAQRLPSSRIRRAIPL